MSETPHPDADADPAFKRLLDELPEAWARLPADDDGGVLVAAHLRAAYATGYVRALEVGAP